MELIKKIKRLWNSSISYTPLTIGGNHDEMKQDFKLLIKKNRDLLSLNGVNLNKIRFVFTPNFLYDIDADIIDPNYMILMPETKRKKTNKYPIVEINRPKNVVGVTVRNYSAANNYELLKAMTKKSKKGIVIYIIEHKNAIDTDGKSFNYEFSVDAEILRLRDLDEINSEVVEDCEQIL